MMNAEARKTEFAKYHAEGDGECNNVVLLEWADRHGLDAQSRYELAFFFSITYCVQSAIILFEEQRNVESCINTWAAQNKSKIVFQSDRKYMRMADRFERCLTFFFQQARSCETVARWIAGGRLDLEAAIRGVEQWPMFGRFSAYLFLETYQSLTRAEIDNAYLDWDHGDTATSGMLNVFGFDAEADLFDKTGKIPGRLRGKMNAMQDELLLAVVQAGGDPNVTKVETSLCAYRKFFKGTRYNGYYLDRMLEEIEKMSRDWPDLSQELLDIRKSKFAASELGENGGWKGVRKEKAKANKIKYARY